MVDYFIEIRVDESCARCGTLSLDSLVYMCCDYYVWFMYIVYANVENCVCDICRIEWIYLNMKTLQCTVQIFDLFEKEVDDYD